MIMSRMAESPRPSPQLILKSCIRSVILSILDKKTIIESNKLFKKVTKLKIELDLASKVCIVSLSAVVVNKCSFQSGFCDWKNIADMDHKWKLSTDLYTLMNYTGVFVKQLKSESFLTPYQKRD